MTLIPQLLLLLRQAGTLLTPEPTLRVDLRLAVSPAPSGTEISEAIDTCERNGWVIGVRDAMTGQLKWRITDSGRVSLAERGL